MKKKLKRKAKRAHRPKVCMGCLSLDRLKSKMSEMLQVVERDIARLETELRMMEGKAQRPTRASCYVRGLLFELTDEKKRFDELLNQWA